MSIRQDNEPSSNAAVREERRRVERRRDGGQSLPVLLGAAHAFMLGRYAPSHLLVDERFDVIHMSAAAGRNLGLKGGAGLHNLSDLRDGGVLTTLRLIAESAVREGKAVVLENIALERGAKARRFALVAEPVSAAGAKGALIFFCEPAEDGSALGAGTVFGDFLNLLLEDTNVPLLIFDRDLNLRSATAAVQSIVNLGNAGKGMPVEGVFGGLFEATLGRDLRRVLDTGRQIERSLLSHVFKDYRIKLLPVPPLAGATVPDGVAVLFQSVRDRTQGETALGFAEELNHRVKNMLGNTIAMASLMLDGVPAMQDFRTAYIHRIQALANANNLVAESNWTGTQIGALFQLELKSHQDNVLARVRVEGPPLVLRARAAVTLGMAIHEMADNAAQYGALAFPGMSLDVSWRREDVLGKPILAIEWVESGGHGIQPPSVKGFGTAFIEQGIAHELSGTVRLQSTEGGYHYRIELPEREALADSSGMAEC